MIHWIEKPLALAIHDRQLAEHGGNPGLRDEALLESALSRPQQRYSYGEPPPDLAELAASLAYGLARNHPFVDGNKRTAAVACETFIMLNAATLVATSADLYPQYLGLADGTITEAEFASWLREHLQLEPGHNIHEATVNYAAR